MKKTSLLIILFLLFFGISFGQNISLQKGTFSINGNISFTSSYPESSELNSSTFQFNPRFDYFVVNNFSLGVMIDYKYHTFAGRNNSSWGIGPSLRYYINFDNIKPFAGAGYSYSYEGFFNSDDYNQYSNIILSIGTDYFINNNVALETVLNYTNSHIKNSNKSLIYSDPDATVNSLSIGVGINFFFR